MRVLLLAVVMLALGGCAMRPEDRLVGVWVIDQDRTTIPTIPIPNMEKQVRNFTRAMTLKLRSDKTFVFASGPTVTGRWALEGDTIRLSPEKGNITGPFGNLIKEMNATISQGYDRLSIEQSTPVGPIVVVLKKTA